VEFGRAVFELCEQPDRQTDRQTYSLQYFVPLLGEVNIGTFLVCISKYYCNFVAYRRKKRGRRRMQRRKIRRRKRKRKRRERRARVRKM